MRTSLIRQYPLAAAIDTVSAWVWVQADVARATRGFALSRLLGNRSPLLAGLLLGIPWGIIHIILHLPGMWAAGLPWLPTIVQLVALSLIITWLYVHSGRSLLLVALFHAAQSAFGYVSEGLAPIHIHWLMMAVWSATAAVALLALAASPRARQPALPAA